MCCLGLRLSYNAPLVMSKKGIIQFAFIIFIVTNALQI